MNKNFIVIAAIALGTAAAQAQTFSGNGGTGFGDQIGSGSITATISGGNVNFSITAGAGGLGNDLALYIDSVSGGFANTSTLTDTADGGRRTLSGKGATTGQSVVTFATGFAADFGIDVTNSSANLFALNTGALGFTPGATFGSTVGKVTTFSLSLSSIGSPASFKFVGNIVNPNDNAGGFNNDLFRSNETFGTSTTSVTGNGNPGNNGTLTFSTFDIVPEPGTTSLLLLGVGGVIWMVKRPSFKSSWKRS